MRNVYVDKRLKGKFIEEFRAPNGRRIITVKVGPNPHEIQHFDAECVEMLDE